MTNSSLQKLNTLDAGDALEYLQHCCDSILWAHQMVSSRPFESSEALFQTSDSIWANVPFDDRLEAFDGHPRFGNQSIGDATLRQRWARQEHSATQGIDADAIERFKSLNLEYENKFGFTFISYTQDKTADDIVVLLEARTPNDPETEVAVASEHQRQIIRSRLGKLLLEIE